MSVYRDFVPKALSEATMFHASEYEDFQAAAEAAVAWIKENNIRILSIETVVIPMQTTTSEIPHEEGVFNTGLARHAQIVRVWYL